MFTYNFIQLITIIVTEIKKVICYNFYLHLFPNDFPLLVNTLPFIYAMPSLTNPTNRAQSVISKEFVTASSDVLSGTYFPCVTE